MAEQQRLRFYAARKGRMRLSPHYRYSTETVLGIVGGGELYCELVNAPRRSTKTRIRFRRCPPPSACPVPATGDLHAGKDATGGAPRSGAAAPPTRVGETGHPLGSLAKTRCNISGSPAAAWMSKVRSGRRCASGNACCRIAPLAQFVDRDRVA